MGRGSWGKWSWDGATEGWESRILLNDRCIGTAYNFKESTLEADARMTRRVNHLSPALVPIASHVTDPQSRFLRASIATLLKSLEVYIDHYYAGYGTNMANKIFGTFAVISRR